MSDVTATVVKRAARTRKTAVSAQSPIASSEMPPAKPAKALTDSFTTLIKTITALQEEYEELQKYMREVKEEWDKEQKLHKLRIEEQDQQEKIIRQREQEQYTYETKLKRRQEEDEFTERKTKWEKELQARKDETAQEKKELEEMRKMVSGFEAEKEKTVKEAMNSLQKTLTDQFATEKKLREQEVKSEKELLVLKITNLTQESARQAKEIEVLKHALNEATAQLKDVAVRVIESSKPQVKPIAQEV